MNSRQRRRVAREIQLLHRSAAVNFYVACQREGVNPLVVVRVAVVGFQWMRRALAERVA